MGLRVLHARAPSWVLVETASAAVFALLSMLIVGRQIGPDAMGLATVALAAFLLLDVLASSLFSDAIVQCPQFGPNHAGSTAATCLLAGTAAALVLIALGPVLAAVAHAPQVTALTWALAPLLPISAWSGAMSGLALRRHRFRLLAARALAGQPIALGAGLLAAVEGYGPWAMIANQAAATAVTFVLLVSARQVTRLRLDRSALRDLWPIAVPQVAAVFVTTGKYRIFLLALGFTVGHSVVALSHAAFRLLDGPLMVVFQSVNRIGLPRMCVEQGHRERLAETFGEMAQLQALLGLPVATGIALVAPAMVLTLLGPEWQAAADAAQIVGFASTIGFLAGDASSLFVAVNKPKRNIVVAVASLVLPLTLLFALRPTTPEGVALCWASQSVLLPPVTAWLAVRELGRSPWWLLGQTAPAVIATLGMVVAVIALRSAVPMRASVQLIASMACGGAVYLGIAAVLLRLRMPTALVPRVQVAAE